MRYQYIILDFNGTVIDDVKLCWEILNKMLVIDEKKPVTFEEYRNIFGFPIISYYRKAGFDFVKNSFDYLADIFISEYQDASLKCDLCPYVEETLEMLKNSGYKIILLSASKKENLVEQIKHFKIDKYFDAVLGLDNIYAESKVALALNYFKENNIDARKTLFIGDTNHDLEVAREAGGDCILVSCGHQSAQRLLLETKNVYNTLKEVQEILRWFDGRVFEFIS